MRAQTNPGKGFRGWKKVLAIAGFLDIMIDCSALEYIAMIVQVYHSNIFFDVYLMKCE